MKKFNKLSMVLFDSTKANFKLSVEANFTKSNNMGGFSPLVYITDNGTGNLNPNIYLTFTYKSDTYDKGNFLYTSYPQLFKIRQVFGQVAKLVENLDAYIPCDDGTYMVKPEYSQPMILTEIGKQNKWLKINLSVSQSTEEGITKAFPSITVEWSSLNGYSAVLTVEEFLTIYTIIRDLDLANLQSQFSLAFLSTMDAPIIGMQQPVYQQPYQARQYSQPNQYYTNNRAQTQTPRYNSMNSYNTPYKQTQQASQTPTDQYGNQMPFPSTPAPQKSATGNTTTLPNRTNSNASVMSFANVEKTPEVETDYNDQAAIDSIFED